MAIVKMNKFTLLAFESQKKELLKELQKSSLVEFINLQDENFLQNNEEFSDLGKDDSGTTYGDCEEELLLAKGTLAYLREFVPQQSGLKAMKEGKKELTAQELEKTVKETDWKAICAKVKEKEDKISELEHEKTQCQAEIEAMKPYESFDVPFSEFKDIKTPYYIGSLPNQYKETIVSEFEDCYVEIISSNNQDVFLFLMCDKTQQEEVSEKLRGFGFSQFKTELEEAAIQIIHDNMDKIEKINSNIFFIKEELAALDEDAKTLELVCEYYDNMTIRKEAVTNFLKTENVAVIQGWLPIEDNEEFTAILNKVLGDEYSLSFEEVKEDEILDVPVKLENNVLNSSFEDITQMYSTPRYNEIDPTPFLAPFYLIFFGMMIGDIGYGLLLLIGTGIVLKLFNLEEGTRRFIKFFFFLSIPSILFGVITGSFFGDLIALPKLIDTNKDINTYLGVSIAFGVIQIFFGLGLKAYMLIRDGKPKDAFYDVGAWVITLISIALVLFGSSIGLPPVGKKIAIGFMVFGMVVIVLTGGRQEKKVGAKLGQGAYSLYGITGYVGDLVSYTRLMALALSGASLGAAMNQLMNMVPGVAGLLFGPIIFLFGHIFNFALSLLGAYVHTCRLQYVEYFAKFYEGGGKAFKPFKTENKFINLKRE